jgi:hypothetical protein
MVFSSRIVGPLLIWFYRIGCQRLRTLAKLWKQARSHLTGPAVPRYSVVPPPTLIKFSKVKNLPIFR